LSPVDAFSERIRTKPVITPSHAFPPFAKGGQGGFAFTYKIAANPIGSHFNNSRERKLTR